MYNSQLDTFVVVADVGSFHKASEILFISPNAVMKQINHLEAHLGFLLFERTHKGLHLTLAGKSLYRDAKYMIQYSQEAVQRAMLQDQKDHVLRIGLSFTTPVEYLITLWEQVQRKYPQLKFELVSFENTPENAREIMRHFGKNIDFVAGIYSENLLKERGCIATFLYRTSICCAVPKSHPLASKEKLCIEDLFGETIYMMKKHYFDDFDIVREELSQYYPSIEIADIPFLNVQVFNQCVNENKIMLAIPELKNVHPMMKMIPMEWAYTIPFGVMYSPKPSRDVLLFIDAIQHIYNK